MIRVRQRHRGDRSGKVSQNFRKQSIMEVHANRLAYFRATHAMKRQRHACLIQVRIKSRRLLECADIELVRIFERDFGFVWNGLAHDTPDVWISIAYS